jgi:hypothetical protein
LNHFTVRHTEYSKFLQQQDIFQLDASLKSEEIRKLTAGTPWSYELCIFPVANGSVALQSIAQQKFLRICKADFRAAFGFTKFFGNFKAWGNGKAKQGNVGKVVTEAY